MNALTPCDLPEHLMREGGAFLVIVAGIVLGWMAVTGRLTCGLAAIRCGFLGQTDPGCQASFGKCGGGATAGTLPSLAAPSSTVVAPAGDASAPTASGFFSTMTNPPTLLPIESQPTQFGPNPTIATA